MPETITRPTLGAKQGRGGAGGGTRVASQAVPEPITRPAQMAASREEEGEEEQARQFQSPSRDQHLAASREEEEGEEEILSGILLVTVNVTCCLNSSCSSLVITIMTSMLHHLYHKYRVPREDRQARDASIDLTTMTMQASAHRLYYAGRLKALDARVKAHLMPRHLDIWTIMALAQPT